MMHLITKILNIWPKRWITTALVVLCILYLTLVPRPLPDNDINIPGLDKVVHALMFGGLAFVAVIDLARMRKRCYRSLTRRGVIAVALSVALFGGGVEIAQDAMDMGRGGDIYDFIADVAGVVIGIYLSRKTIVAWQKQKASSSC